MTSPLAKSMLLSLRLVPTRVRGVAGVGGVNTVAGFRYKSSSIESQAVLGIGFDFGREGTRPREEMVVSDIFVVAGHSLTGGKHEAAGQSQPTK